MKMITAHHKNGRVAVAQRTLQNLEDGFYINNNSENVTIKDQVEFCIKNSEHFDHISDVRQAIKFDELMDFETEVQVVNMTSFDAAKGLFENTENVTVLNFASGKNPGGGFLWGTRAQEECLARSSALYPCLKQFTKKPGFYYEVNSGNDLSTDCAIFSPLVPVFYSDKVDATPLDKPFCVNILTIPAPKTSAYRREHPDCDDIVRPIMAQRIDKLLGMILYRGSNECVLGAFGCGVYGNDPVFVARTFHDLLNNKYKGKFRKVVFAIYSRPGDRNFQIFQSILMNQ